MEAIDKAIRKCDYNYDHSPDFWNKRSIYGWIAKGYQKYKKRFGDNSDNVAQRLFKEIEKIGDEFLKNDYGYTATLNIDFKSLRCYIEEEEY